MQAKRAVVTKNAVTHPQCFTLEFKSLFIETPHIVLFGQAYAMCKIRSTIIIITVRIIRIIIRIIRRFIQQQINTKEIKTMINDFYHLICSTGTHTKLLNITIFPFCYCLIQGCLWIGFSCPVWT